jgi:outer membrane protein
MKVLLLIAGVTASIFSFAQTDQQKIGHADWNEIVRQLPETKQMEKDLLTYQSQLEQQMRTKSMEFEKKYKEYESLPADTPEAVRKFKESELMTSQESMKKLQQDAYAAIEKKQKELLTPILARIEKAIQQVAAENNLAYILNLNTFNGDKVVLFGSKRFDVTTMVIQKLSGLD